MLFQQFFFVNIFQMNIQLISFLKTESTNCTIQNCSVFIGHGLILRILISFQLVSSSHFPNVNSYFNLQEKSCQIVKKIATSSLAHDFVILLLLQCCINCLEQDALIILSKVTCMQSCL